MNFVQRLLFLAAAILTCTSCDKDHISNNLHELPVVFLDASFEDLFSDSTGIYVEGIGTGENWQGMRANYFDGRKITANFQYVVDGELVVDQRIDMKVSGGGSRKLAQKSFNIYAEEKHGEERFFYSFFKNRKYHEFSALRLRVSGQDWHKTHMRDALMHVLTEEMQVYNQAYQPVVLYLNKKYWGIYNLREKFNKTYIRNTQEYAKSMDFDIMERRWNVEEGDSIQYMEMIRLMEVSSLADGSVYDSIESLIDIPHHIDYMCSQIYFANTDWPGNNIKFWKAKKVGEKWSWFMHDTDLGFGFAPANGHPGGVEHNTFLFNMNDKEPGDIHNQPWATFVFRKLMENERYRQTFYERMEYLLLHQFKQEIVLQTIDKLQDNIQPEIGQHIQRWKNEDENFPQSEEEWEGNVEDLRIFARKRPQIILTYISDYYAEKGWK